MPTTSTGEPSQAGRRPQQPPDTRGQPLDLRLLPAALVAWTAALMGIYSAPEVTLGLGLVVLGVGALSAAALWLLPSASSARLWGTALQTALCLVVGGAVLLSAGVTQHRLESAGWTDAVESPAPVEVTLRV